VHSNYVQRGSQVDVYNMYKKGNQSAIKRSRRQHMPITISEASFITLGSCLCAGEVCGSAVELAVGGRLDGKLFCVSMLMWSSMP
jgi:hypothetical protein